MKPTKWVSSHRYVERVRPSVRKISRVVKPATMSIEMEIGDVVCNSKGVTSAQITNKKGAPHFERLTGIDEPITTPFGASTFNDSTATRKNICFRCTPKLAKRLAAIDAYLQSYIEKHSGRLFKGKKLTYKPLLIPQKDDYEPLMQCKINTEGRGACRCCNNQQERVDMPEDLRDCMLCPRVQIKSLWIMGDSCGVTCDAVDLLVFAIKAECPFVDEA